MCLYGLSLTTSLCLTPQIICSYLYCYVSHVLIMACSCHYILFFLWLLTVKTDKHFLLLWLCNCYSLNTVVSWLANRKIINSLSSKLPLNRKTCITFKNPDAYQSYLWIFWKIQMPSCCFFLQSSRCVSNEQPCLKTNCVMIFYFYLVCFTFSVSYSVLLCHKFLFCHKFL